MSIQFTMSDVVAIENLSIRWAYMYDTARDAAKVEVGVLYTALDAYADWCTSKEMREAFDVDLADVTQLYRAYDAFLRLRVSWRSYQAGELKLSLFREAKKKFVTELRKVEY